MTTVKLISQLNAASALTAADLLPVSQNGVSKSATFAQVQAAASSGIPATGGLLATTGAVGTAAAATIGAGLVFSGNTLSATAASSIPATGGILATTGTLGQAGAVTLGSGLALAGGVLSASGAVSSVVGQAGVVTMAQIAASGFTATGGTASRNSADRFGDKKSILDIAGVVADGATDAAPPIRAWIALQTAGAELDLTVPKGAFYLGSPVNESSGRILHWTLAPGAALSGPGYLYGTTYDQITGPSRIAQSNLATFSGGYTPTVGRQEYSINRTALQSLGRTYTYQSTPTGGVGGGDTGDYGISQWFTGTTGVGLISEWRVAISPVNRTSDGATWGLVSTEYNPVNNGPDNYGWRANIGSATNWAAGPWCVADPTTITGTLGGNLDHGFGVTGQGTANHRWNSYPAIFSGNTPANLTATDAITFTTLSGTNTVTFSGGVTPTLVVSQINAGATVAKVSASLDTFGRIVIYNTAGFLGNPITLANSFGTPLATIGMPAGTFTTTNHEPTGLPYLASFYNAFMVYPRATAAGGYGYYAWGNGTAPGSGLQINAAGGNLLPYSPAGYGGNWLHGLDLINLIPSDNNAMLLKEGQSLAWFPNPATGATSAITATGGVITLTNSGLIVPGTLAVNGTGATVSGTLGVGQDATFYSGLNTNSGVGSSTSDLSKGLRLYSTLAGVAISASRLNTIIPLGWASTTVVNSVDILSTTSTGVAVTGTLSASGGITGTLTGTATNITGNLAVTNLNSGTGASISTYWRGDGTWAAVAAGSTGTVTSVTGSGGTTGLTLAGGPITTAGTLTLGGTLGLANGGTGVTTGTGTGSVVLSVSPALTGTPTIGGFAAVAVDGTGKIPTGLLPASVIGALNYQGAWNASTNTPALVSATGTKGFYYSVSVTGATTLDGISQWNVGDHAAYNGTAWEKFDGIASEVITVAGRTGNVVLAVADVSGALSTTTAATTYAPLASPTFTGTATSPAFSGPLTGNVTGNASGTAANVTGIVAVLNGGTGVTTSTGTGSVVLSTSPALVTPALGTPSAAVLTNATGLPLTSGITGTLGLANGGTGQITASAALIALGGLSSTTGVTITSTTGVAQLPVGNTAQQLSTGNQGEIRFNSQTARFEHGIGGAWKNFVRLDGDTLTGALIGTTATMSGAIQGTTITGTTSLVASSTNNVTMAGSASGPVSIKSNGTNIGIAIVPNGTGAFSLAVPDSTAVGGNARGQNAVDLALARSSASQVASGNGSFIGGGGVYSTLGSGYAATNTASNTNSVAVGGRANVASGDHSAVLGGFANTASIQLTFIGGGWANTASGGGATIGGGQSNTASGGFSFIGGGLSNTTSGSYGSIPGGIQAIDRGRYASVAFSSGQFSTTGDAQTATQILRVSTSAATSARLTADAGAAGAANIMNIPSNTGYSLRIVVTAIDTVTKDVATWQTSSNILLRRVALASTTAFVGTPAFTAGPNSGGGSLAAIGLPTIVADTTNAGINISVTPATTNLTHFIATVYADGEIQ